MATDLLAFKPTAKSLDKSITSYFNDGMHLQYKSGETIINSFDEPHGVYLIKKGFVKAYSVSKAGNGNLLMIHASGEFIPLPWALNGANITGLAYEAMTEVTVIKAPKDKLRTAMGSNVWLTQEILNQAVNVIALYTQRIQTLEFRSARGRIIAELLHLAERFGVSHSTRITINTPITHQDIADSINMSRETASREIELLFKDGLLGQKEHLFIILDYQKLQLALS